MLNRDKIILLLMLSIAGFYVVSHFIPFFYNYLARRTICREIVAIRELPVVKQVKSSTLSREEFRTEYCELAKDYYVRKPLSSHVKLLMTLNLLDRNIPLRSILIKHTLTTILGVHFPDSPLIISDSNIQVVSDRLYYQPLEKSVFAQEIVHALQHQNFDVRVDWWPSIPFDSNEAVKGKRALVEGDARFTMKMYINACLPEDQQVEVGTLVQKASEKAGNQYIKSLPPIIRDELYFKYDEGEDFVRALYQHDGWNAVNKAYSNPPLSTEQILHPDRYMRGDPPVPVSLPVLKSLFNIDWVQVDHGEIGEFLLRKHLMRHLSEDRATIASTGWGGDYYQLCERKADKEKVLVMRIVWDDRSESDQFFSIYTEYGRERFHQSTENRQQDSITWTAHNNALLLMRRGKETVIVYAPDSSTLASLKIDIFDMYLHQKEPKGSGLDQRNQRGQVLTIDRFMTCKLIVENSYRQEAQYCTV